MHRRGSVILLAVGLLMGSFACIGTVRLQQTMSPTFGDLAVREGRRARGFVGSGVDARDLQRAAEHQRLDDRAHRRPDTCDR